MSYKEPGLIYTTNTSALSMTAINFSDVKYRGLKSKERVQSGALFPHTESLKTVWGGGGVATKKTEHYLKFQIWDCFFSPELKVFSNL